MSKVISVLKRDLERIRGNVIACIVAVGLVIVPTLYAWFNIAGSWDPYGNTGSLKVAVANSDEGYLSDLIPVRVNIGDAIVSSLRENDDIDWVFVKEGEAVEGVRSGAYYAAVVIPENFSSRMMTVFSSDAEHAEVEYYENQKANAIAPRVTDKAADTVRRQIDQTFTETIGDVGLATASSLLEFMDGDQVAKYAANMSGTLGAGIDALRDASKTAGEFAGVVGSSVGLLDSAGDLLSQAGGTGTNAEALLGDVKAGLAGMDAALDDAVGAIDEALESSAGDYEAAGKAIEGVFDSVESHVEITSTQLRSASSKIAVQAEGTRDVQRKIEALRDEVDGLQISESAKEDLIQRIDTAADAVGNMAGRQELLSRHLSDAAASLEAGMDGARKQAQEVSADLEEAKLGVSSVEDTYKGALEEEVSELASAVSDVAKSGEEMADGLSATADDLSRASKALSGDLSDAKGGLVQAADDLTASADELQRLKDDLDAAVASGDAQRLRDLIGSDPTSLAEALAAPVALDREAVYHIRNYGSAMAPFYTTLSIWVAGIVFAAMLRVEVDERDVSALAPIRLHELYLGRYALFALLAFAQATLVCAGDLLFFGIQCGHPLQFTLVGWVAGFVFSNMVYTLTVSFGDVGKAVAVVLLVMQVAGSGGTFPIEMTADFFQGVYPLLPFTHAINAMHTAMAGGYGMEFWRELGILAGYLLPFLALGLVFRRPVIRANRWVVERLEETKLM